MRLGVARTYWYAWDDPLDVLGVTMSPGGPSQRSFTALQGWVVGSRFRGCTSRASPSGGVVTTCRFTRGGRSSVIVWGSGDVVQAVPLAATSICSLLDGCGPVDPNWSVTTSPVLLRE
ncbi:MAG: hypothetical protein ABIV05_05325 [Actinomycetota bacterium]